MFLFWFCYLSVFVCFLFVFDIFVHFIKDSLVAFCWERTVLGLFAFRSCALLYCLCFCRVWCLGQKVEYNFYQRLKKKKKKMNYYTRRPLKWKWTVDGRGFDPRVRQNSFVEIGHCIIESGSFRPLSRSPLSRFAHFPVRPESFRPRVVSPTFPFAPESFRPFSRSPPSRFAPL